MSKSPIRYFKAVDGAVIRFRQSRNHVYRSYVLARGGFFSPHGPNAFKLAIPASEITPNEYARLLRLKEERIWHEKPATYRVTPADSWVCVADWEAAQDAADLQGLSQRAAGAQQP